MLKIVLAACLLLAITEAQQPQQGCSSDSDCTADQCCSTSLFGHLGGSSSNNKKKRFLLDNIFGHNRLGTCKPLAEEGESCEPDMLVIGGSKAHSFGCPCAADLECHGERESHHGGSHSYTNPKCMPAGTYTGPVVTHTAVPERTTEQPATINTDEPVAELPGK